MLGKIDPRIPVSVYPQLPSEIKEKLCNPRFQEECCTVYGVGKNKHHLLAVTFRAIGFVELRGKVPVFHDFLHLTGLDESDISVIRQRMLEAGWQPYTEDWEMKEEEEVWVLLSSSGCFVPGTSNRSEAKAFPTKLAATSYSLRMGLS